MYLDVDAQRELGSAELNMQMHVSVGREIVDQALVIATSEMGPIDPDSQQLKEVEAVDVLPFRNENLLRLWATLEQLVQLVRIKQLGYENEALCIPLRCREIEKDRAPPASPMTTPTARGSSV